jgi:hypothetical protein
MCVGLIGAAERTFAIGLPIPDGRILTIPLEGFKRPGSSDRKARARSLRNLFRSGSSLETFWKLCGFRCVCPQPAALDLRRAGQSREAGFDR